MTTRCIQYHQDGDTFLAEVDGHAIKIFLNVNERNFKNYRYEISYPNAIKEYSFSSTPEIAQERIIKELERRNPQNTYTSITINPGQVEVELAAA